MFLSLYVKGKAHALDVRDRVIGRITKEDGAVATEYGLLLVLIAIAIVAAATLLGKELINVFTEGKDSLAGA